MLNEPQLSAESEVNIIDLIDPKVPFSHFIRVLEKHTQQAITTALEEQKKATLDLLDKAELEKWFDMPDTTENWKTWKKIRNTINREDV